MESVRARTALAERADAPFRRFMACACLESGEEHLRRGHAQAAFRLVSESLEWDPDHWPAMDALAHIDLGKTARRRRLPWVAGTGIAAIASLVGYFAGSRRQAAVPMRPAILVPLGPELLGTRRGASLPTDGPGFSEGNAPGLPAVLRVAPQCRCSVFVDGAPAHAEGAGDYALEAGHHAVQLRRAGKLFWQGRVKATAYQVLAVPGKERMP